MFVTAHGIWAGPIVGLLSFGESLAIIGLFIPATAVMIAIGGLIGTGVLDPAAIILWAVGGAILGDWISYWMGRRIGPSVYHRWPLNRHRPMVARTRLFFRKYGLTAVFLGRFLGPMRDRYDRLLDNVGKKNADRWLEQMARIERAKR